MGFQDWLNKGDGGLTPYEPYVTNRDLLFIFGACILVSLIILIGCLML